MPVHEITPDILVLGLGPAGACAAREAAQAGCSVLALERKAQAGAPVQCAEFVPAMLGSAAPAPPSARVQPITAMVTQVESQAPDQMANFPGRMIDRSRFDAALVQAAQQAGADCRFATPVCTVEADGSVKLANGAVLRPKLLIGADGPRSLAGRAMGAVNNVMLETRQITVPLLKPFHSTDIYLSADFPGGYGWLFPKGAVAHLGLGVSQGEKARLKPMLERLHRKLVAQGRVGREILNHTGGAIPAGGIRGPSGRLGGVPVLLAGDAAGLTNPVTGAGINAAVQSGALAGEAAADWRAGEGAALADYMHDLEALFGRSLRRALERRKALLRRFARHQRPPPEALRASWIAYAPYWAA